MFELGVPLATTMRNEQHSELHKFHNAHRWEIKWFLSEFGSVHFL